MGLRSRSLHVGALALVASLGAGCEVEWNDPPFDTRPETTELDTPEQVIIDADATLEVKPGEGVGVFVEYTSGGRWRVYTSCDVNVPGSPGVPCEFDIFATNLERGGALENPAGQGLTGQDGLVLNGDGSLHLYAQNGAGLTGMEFDAAPGAIVELEVYLDGVPDPHFVYWLGKGVLHQGAPTNPVDFVPSEAP